ncbi:MAG: SpoIVB peptidase S55 domain-containing protein [Polyangiaceae bacterium]
MNRAPTSPPPSRRSFFRRPLGLLTRSPLLAGAIGGTLVAAGIGASIAHAAPGKDPDTMPVSDIKPGMKGYGLTVMSGTKPEKFDVEVISVLTNFRPNQDLVLVKTPNHPRLEAAKTVAGMSGSPIYLEGKMIGAYAYGWTFGSEPIAGITPIQNMMDDLQKPIPPLFQPRLPKATKTVKTADAAPPRSSRSFNGDDLVKYDLDVHAQQLAKLYDGERSATTEASLAPAETPVLFAGLSPRSMGYLERTLGPMGLDVMAGGGTGKEDPDAPTMYEDGGAIGVQLVRGDMSSMALGTVTRVVGDKLVAFGHPMMGGGASDLPTCIGKVHWILASTNRSFKIGESARSMGTLVNDRQASIVIDTKRTASTFPVHVDIQGVDGAPKTVWDMEVTHDPFMAPAYAATAVGNALETTTPERGDFTWKAHTDIQIDGYGTLGLDDFGSSAGDPISADSFGRARFVRALGALLNNPWERVKINGMSTTVKVTFKREVSLLRSVEPLETEIDPGQPLHIKLTLVPYLGTTEDKVIEVPIPLEYAGQDVDVDLSPGFEVERPRANAEDVSELVAQLADPTYPNDSIVATVRLQNEGGAAYRGNVAERLPPAALDALRVSASSVGPDTFGAYVQTTFPMQRYVVGRDHVRVKVRAPIK